MQIYKTAFFVFGTIILLTATAVASVYLTRPTAYPERAIAANTSSALSECGSTQETPLNKATCQ